MQCEMCLLSVALFNYPNAIIAIKHFDDIKLLLYRPVLSLKNGRENYDTLLKLFNE